MIRFLMHRLLQALLVLAAMSAVIYLLIGLMPGDPIDEMLSANPNITPDDAARLKALYGLDQPIWRRYVAWLGSALSGDLGYSRLYAQPVLAVVGPRLANTALLMAGSLALALAIAVPLGIAAARRAGSLADRAINLLCFAGVSLPTFWLALLMIMLFAVTLQWLPAGGIASVDGGGLGDRLLHAVLPVATLTLATIPAYCRHMRAAMIEVLGSDYIRTARAKGAPERRVVWRHGLRNALIPLITILALDIGALFSGALLVETMFAFLGMGKLIFDAVMGNDFNLALVGLLFATAMTLAGNLAADIAYARLDPRIRYARG